VKRGKFFRKNRYFLLVLIGILLIFPFLMADDTPTEIIVLNSPPYLIESIPDQAWPQNTNLLSAFDLDDYFLDPNGDNLTFTNSSIDDVYVYIDPITHVVSFYPETDFIGLKNVTFYADDGNFSTSSNVVSLYVGLDNVSPTWRSPARSKGDVYQNDQINFSVIWSDNVALSYFIFSIKQGVNWGNYSAENISGIEDIAIHEVQISAAQSSVVYWMMYAWDTSNNTNSTDIQSFTVSAPVGVESPPPSDDEGTIGGRGDRISEAITDLGLTPTRRLKDFKLSLFDIKFSMKQGTTKTAVLKITNTGTEDLNFTMEDTGLWDFVIFSEEKFGLLPGNSKEITIDFDVPRSAYPGQYFGFIWAKTGAVNKTVPVVLDINAIDLDYEIKLNISEDFKTVLPEELVQANLYIYNIKDLFQTNVTLHYSLKDYTGIVYNFSEEIINFSTSFVINRSLQVPSGTPKGKYLFYARISDNENVAIDSDFFFVGEKFSLSSFIKSKLLFFFIILLAVFLAIFMVKYQKDRRKERVLHLYMMLTKLKNLIKQEKNQEALELFLRIRSQYKEPLSKEILQDKSKLKKEMLKLYESINPEALKRIQEQEKQNAKQPPQTTSTSKVPTKPEVIPKKTPQKSSTVPPKSPVKTKPLAKKPATTVPLVKKIAATIPLVKKLTPTTPPKPVAPSKTPTKPAVITKKPISPKLPIQTKPLIKQKIIAPAKPPVEKKPLKKPLTSNTLVKKEVTKSEQK